MGFPKAQWPKNSNLPAFCNAGYATPRIFMLSFVSSNRAGGTTTDEFRRQQDRLASCHLSVKQNMGGEAALLA